MSSASDSATGDIQVRPASPADLQRVIELLRPFMHSQQLLERTEDEVAGLLPNGFVAMRGSELVGFAALEVYSRKMAEIQCLAVLPTARGLGLGKQLIEQCVARARQLGVREVMAITASETLFMACGFDYSLPGQKKALFITP